MPMDWYVPDRSDITSLVLPVVFLTARIPRRTLCSSTAKSTWTLDGYEKGEDWQQSKKEVRCGETWPAALLLKASVH